MRLPIAPRVAIVALALATGLGAVHASASRGGLSISPGILEHVASRGGVGAVKISNTTGAPMGVQLAVRPWLQSRSGAVSPDRRRTLGSVRPSRASFGLRAGATRSIGLSLLRRPPRGSLYGAIEVTGTPRRRGGRGVKVAYRLVTSLRLNPPAGARVFRARAGGLVEHGTTRHGVLLLAVRNTGNTIVPIGGRVRISGHRHTLRNEIAPKAILPGATVNLSLTRLRGTLSRGSYRVKVRLSQGGHPLGTITRRGVHLR